MMEAHQAQSYPLAWPVSLNKPRTPPSERKRAAFGQRNAMGYGNRSLSVAQARERVLSELDRITRPGQSWRVPPESIVISTNVPTRKDGLPRSDRRDPTDPGVAVYFTLDERPRCLPCDKWDRVADNLAAIAKDIEANRGKERWGVSSVDESYSHAALPAPDSVVTQHWYDVLGLSTPTVTDEALRAAYLAARKAAHPDSGGSTESFHKVQLAWQQARQERDL